MPRAERWRIGAALVSEYRRLVQAKETPLNPSHGFAAISRGGLVCKMWVLKQPFGSLRRGEKVRRRALKEHMEAQGARFREVMFPRSKEQRDALKRMAKAMAPLHHASQYGFVPQRDCLASAAKHANARVVYLLDIEDAFGQVTYLEVVEMLRKVFYVNAKDANFIASLACHRGRLYQGNPIAPVLFNIRAMWMVDRLTRLCRSVGATVTVYADDVTISHDAWTHFSNGFRKTALKVIRECGLKVNREKCKVRRVSPRKVGHYDITGLAIDFDPDTRLPYVRPLHRRRTARKAAFLDRALKRGAETSFELCKDGATPKKLEAVVNGLRQWEKRQPPPGEYPQRRLPIC